MGKSKIGIIIGREYAIRVNKKSFILTTILTPLLFAGLMVVPGLIAVYSDDNEKIAIQVNDNSGIVMPYLESTDKVIFKEAKGESIDELKQAYNPDETFAILDISQLDSNKNVMVSTYSVKQINSDLQSQIKKDIQQALESNKLKSYNIPDLDKVLSNIKSDVQLNTFTIDEKTGEEKESKVELYMGIGYAASFLIYMFIFMFGSMVMRSVIEEKTTRIVEVIISSVKPFQLMMGKIIGVASVALTQFFIWIALTVAIVVGVTMFVGKDSIKESVSSQVSTSVQAVPLSTSTDSTVLNLDPGKIQSDYSSDGFDGFINALKQIDYVSIIFCFIIYFALGYLLYASMFAAVGSAVDNEADTQQLIFPITLPLIIGLFIMLHTFQHPDSALSFWGSIIPFTSPMVMMARIAYGVPTWELCLSIGLLVITFILFAFISAKIYRIGILMYGKKASWKDLMKWIRL